MKRILLFISVLTILGVLFEIGNIYTILDRPISGPGYFHFLDRNGNTLTLQPQKDGYGLPYRDDLENQLVKDIISIEDRRYYSHLGIDILSKLNVIWESLLAKKITRGGSTITEQYIKNRYFPTAPRTILQKIREGMWAMTAELKYEKSEILKKYLETVYMGNAIYGIPAALENYFQNKKITELSDEEISEIIVRLRFPNLGGSSEMYRKQIAERLGFQLAIEPLKDRQRRGYIDILPFLTERIKSEIYAYCAKTPTELHEFVMSIPDTLCSSTYIKLELSIDNDASKYALDTLESILYPLEEKNVHNGAIYVWSQKEQKVLIYIGNRNKATGNGYDMIIKKRSVGSVLKPFLYLIALHGHDPNDLLLDEKKIYETQTEGISYVPENYIPKSYGPVTLKDALGNSLNSAAVRLAEDIGISRVYASFRSLGLPLDHDASYYGYGIVLGAIELSLEHIVRGYRNIMDLRDRENFLLFDMLSDSANRSMTFGESSILNTSILMAVKTGTSTDFRDNWTIGYNQDIVIGVWVGNTDGSSMNDVSGITGAGPIFHRVAEDLISRGYTKKQGVTLPTGIVENYLCKDEKCFQKEISYTHSGYTRKSRPASKLYYESDFVTPLSPEEKENWKIR